MTREHPTWAQHLHRCHRLGRRLHQVRSADLLDLAREALGHEPVEHEINAVRHGRACRRASDDRIVNRRHVIRLRGSAGTCTP